MLRTLWIVVAVLVAATPAWAQQDPELEPVDRTEDREDDTEVEPAPPRVTDPIGAESDSAPIELRWEPDVRAEVRAGAGALRGDTINPGRGALSLVEGRAAAGLARGRLSFEAPLEFAHRQAIGAADADADRVADVALQLQHQRRRGFVGGLPGLAQLAWTYRI